MTAVVDTRFGGMHLVDVDHIAPEVAIVTLEQVSGYRLDLLPHEASALATALTEEAVTAETKPKPLLRSSAVDERIREVEH